ncbi:uncharacterized protein EI90DRAFT_3013172 [Cantharellus anzutake]|uniref:uncharacterized protein n=1 Tax=Cantharellus anzutake TaxID=1750568 RepID=UPI001905A8CC|nr:uncharacterized protein EI90DRAFT_3013172 [Cantharellus anzutake]KAF8339118.1 hypothetical protein EI90DRAFT_3013172 [Cantharellus anzutake]
MFEESCPQFERYAEKTGIPELVGHMLNNGNSTLFFMFDVGSQRSKRGFTVPNPSPPSSFASRYWNTVNHSAQNQAKGSLALFEMVFLINRKDAFMEKIAGKAVAEGQGGESESESGNENGNGREGGAGVGGGVAKLTVYPRLKVPRVFEPIESSSCAGFFAFWKYLASRPFPIDRFCRSVAPGGYPNGLSKGSSTRALCFKGWSILPFSVSKLQFFYTLRKRSRATDSVRDCRDQVSNMSHCIPVRWFDGILIMLRHESEDPREFSKGPGYSSIFFTWWIQDGTNMGYSDREGLKIPETHVSGAGLIQDCFRTPHPAIIRSILGFGNLGLNGKRAPSTSLRAHVPIQLPTHLGKCRTPHFIISTSEISQLPAGCG